MRKLFHVILILLPPVLLAGALKAQPISDREWWNPGKEIHSLLDTTDRISVDFQHTLSLFTWNSILQYQLNPLRNRTSGSTTFRLLAKGASKLREDTRIRTSDASASVNTEYFLDDYKNALTLSLTGSTYSLSGSANRPVAQIGTLTSVSDGDGIIGAKLYLNQIITIAPGVGIEKKSLEIGSSTGWIGNVSMSQSMTPLAEGNEIEDSLLIDERRFTLSNEIMRNDYIRTHLISVFGAEASNDVAGGISLKRRDFFFPKDSILAKQERTEIQYDLHDVLNYPIVPQKLTGNFRLDLVPRQITRRTPTIDLATLSSTALIASTFLVPSTSSAVDAGLSGRLDLLLGDQTDTTNEYHFSTELRFEEKSETNSLIFSETGALQPLVVTRVSDVLAQTSYDGKQTSLNVSAFLPISRVDKLHLEFNSRIFRYDTPSKENHDDRDELNMSAFIQYAHSFTPRFELNTELKLSQGHLVYLESDRSLQNYVSKTIALSSETKYAASGFLHQLRAEVFANYAVYDFSSPVAAPSGIRDYLIRGFDATDSIKIPFGKSPIFFNKYVHLESHFDLRLYDRGAYNANSFREKPVLRTSEISGDLTIDLSDVNTSSPALVKLGARSFFLRRYSPNTSSASSELPLQEQLDRIGPLLVVVLDQNQTKGLRLYGDVWYSIVTSTAGDTHLTNSSHQIEARLSAQWSF
ncbi:MAG: hypothetical protein WCH46_02815 [bacterium]